MQTSAGIAIGPKGSAAEAVAAAQVLAGGIHEVALAVAIDVNAAPDQRLGRHGRRLDLGHGQSQRGVGALDAMLQRGGADRVGFGSRLRGETDEAPEHRRRQNARAPYAAMA